MFLSDRKIKKNLRRAKMRKLKLQMQITVDGFVARPNGELDWMTWNWDDGLKAHVNELHKPVDTILLGRKMTDGFISYWSGIIENPQDESYEIGKKMMDTEKIVFTGTLTESDWKNTRLATGDLSEEIAEIKDQTGGDIIVYGGTGFVSSLINGDLIDEYHFFINPVAIGKGLTIFGALDDKRDLKLVESKAFDCGVVVMRYQPTR